MARVISIPDQHRCLDELDQLGPQPIGTVAECSCGTNYVVREHQLDGPYWAKQTTK